MGAGRGVEGTEEYEGGGGGVQRGYGTYLLSVLLAERFAKQSQTEAGKCR